MAHLAGQPRSTHVPWTTAEQRAYLALAAHCQGAEGVPACEVCRTPEPVECRVGADLRQALRRATSSRSQGVRQ